jgi:excisionase family DNA binding protein
MTLLDLWRIRAAAERWGVSVCTVRRWIKKGLIRVVVLGGQTRIPRAEVERVARHGTALLIDVERTLKQDAEA